MSLRNRIEQWPLFRQLTSGGDGTGPEAMSDATRALGPRHQPAQVARSVCPYCAVGCGQLIFHRNGAVVSVEGDPASPISEGRLCPKGAPRLRAADASGPATRVKYRAPHATEWTEIDLDTAMEMVAERVWQSRGSALRGAAMTDDGALRSCSAPSIAHLGGATLDNEENYLIKKLFTGGLGIVSISNQARI